MNDPLLKSLVERVSGRLAHAGSTSAPKVKEPRKLIVEALEPRILFSGSPAPAPEPAPQPEAEPAQEATVQETEAAAAPTTTSEVGAAAAVATAPAPSSEGETVVIESTNDAPAADALSDGVTAIALTDTEVAALADAATNIWIASGISEAQGAALASATYVIADLGGNTLGAAEGTMITIDDDAAGRGWFVDSTPEDSGEFSLLSSSSSTGVDLLTAILHEQGHLLGLDDHGAGVGDIMFEFLGQSERRLPGAGEAAGALAGSLEGTHFLTFGPVTETYEDESAGVTFSEPGGPVFTVDGDLTVVEDPGLGAGLSNWFVDSGIGDGSSTAVVGSIQIAPGNIFSVDSLDVWTSDDDGNNPFSGNIIFRGTPSGGGAALVETISVTSGGSYDTITFTGALQNASITDLEFEIPGGSTIDYIAIDNFIYTHEPFAAPPVTGSSSLVGLWQFEGDFTDTSGTGNDGSQVNGVTFSAGQAGFGQAADFSGSDTHVLVPHDTTLDMTSAMTITAWVNADGNAWEGILAKSPSDGSGANQAGNYELRLENGAEPMVFLYQRGGANDTAGVNGGAATNVPTGSWQHIAVTVDGSGPTETISYYLNGSLVNTLSGPDGFGATNTNPLYIGSRADLFTDFDGQLDDVAIFNEVLNAGEIATIMGGDFSAFLGVSPPLIAVDDSSPGIIDTTPTQVATSSAGAFTVSDSDLLEGLTATVSGTALGGQEGTSNNAAILTNGQFGTAGGPLDLAETVSIANNTTLTYALDTSANPLGFNITGVSTYSGWRDAGRDRQDYTVQYATVDNPGTFIDLVPTVSHNPSPSPSSEVANTADPGLSLAVGVGEIRFVFGGQENGYSGYRELDVFGQAIRFSDTDSDVPLVISAPGLLGNDSGGVVPGPDGIITGVSIEDVSSELTASFNRDADYVLDGSGLTGAQHGVAPDGTMWLNSGNGCCGNPADPTAAGAAAVITFDLGGNYDLENFHVWNYNETQPNLNKRGANLVEILVADSVGGTFTSLGDFNFAQASGLTSYTGEDIDLSGFVAADDARLIRFNIKSNHAGDNEFVGLSEVQFTGAAVGPTIITGVSVEDVSSELTTSFNRDADYLLDSSGLNGAQHGVAPDGTMWLNSGNGCCGDPADPTAAGAAAEITFDLGGNYDLENFHVWNYNETQPNLNKRGANLVEISVASTVGGTFTSLGDFNFAQASGLTSYTGEDIDLSAFVAADDARLVRFNIKSNHAGDNEFVGLSEVQFYSAPKTSLVVSDFDATSAEGATVTVNPDGSFIYDPTGSATLQALNPGDSLVDTFTYEISDGLTAELLSEDFAGTGPLNGTSPDTGAGTWIASNLWNADGTKTTNGTAGAFLPFTPDAGAVYTLSLTVNPDTTASSDWFALGFTENANTNAWHAGGSTNVPTGWLLNREDDTSTSVIQTFLGPNTGGGGGTDLNPDVVGPLDVQIVLDTTAANWTLEWFADGNSIRGPEAFATNPTINYVGIGGWSTATGSISNFSLTGPAKDTATVSVTVNGVAGSVPIDAVDEIYGATVTLGNGDFETDAGDFDTFPGYISNPANPAQITDWTFSGTGQAGINPGAGAGAPFRDNGGNNTNVAFIQGSGSLSQTVSGLSVGTTYELTFDYNERSTNGGGTTIMADIAGANFTDTANNPVGGTNPYHRASLIFTATSETELLTLTSASNGGDQTSLFDNVSVRKFALTNGDFETDAGDFDTFPGYISNPANPAQITGWTFSGTGQAGINPGVGAGAPFRDNGDNLTNVAFIQATGALSQTVTGLIPGATYDLTFDYNERSTNGGSTTITASIAGETFTDTNNAPVGGSNPYHQASLRFTATSATELLTLTSASNGGDQTSLFDNILVTEFITEKNILNVPATGVLANDSGVLTTTFSAGTGSSLGGATNLDTANGTRLNIDEANTVTLDAGTYDVSSISFNADAGGGGGFVRPFLARATGANQYETLWVGAPVNVTSTGEQTISYGGESLTLASTTEIFSGIYHTGGARVFFAGGGTTDHDGTPAEPTAAGETVAGISNPDLGRTYAFGVDLVSPTVIAFDSTSANGAAVSVNADGSFTYDPTQSFAIQNLDDGESITDTFTYTITNGQPAPYSDVVTALNPIAYYTMDAIDVTGNTVANSGSLTNTASLVDGATFTGATGGIFGGGLNVDDNSNHRLLVDSGEIDIGDDWTISAWFNDLHDTSNWRTLTRGLPNDHQIIVEAGQNDLGIFANGNGNFRDSGADLLPGDTAWHHIAAVGNASSNTTTFYIDGVIVGQSDRSSTTSIEAIGNHLTGTQPFAQTIDEFAVFDYGLSEAQIATLASPNPVATDTATVSIVVNGVTDLDAVDDTYTHGSSIAVANWDFEADNYTVFPGYTSGNGGTISGWTHTGGAGINPISNGQAPFRNNGDNNTQVAFVQGTGSLSQTINGLTPGTSYELTFDYNERAAGGSTTVTANIAGETFTDTNNFPVGGSNPYHQASLVFTATAASELLTLTSASNGGDQTSLFDNVVIRELITEDNVFSVSAPGVLANDIPVNGAANIGAGGSLGGATVLDSAGARLNIDLLNVVTLDAGTYEVGSVDFKAVGPAGSGFIRPFLAIDLGGGNYETIWVGDQIDVAADGVDSVSYSGESITLSSTTTVYSGVYHDGTDKVYLANGTGLTDHDGTPTEPTAAGQTIGGISNPDLGRTYAFGVNLITAAVVDFDPTSANGASVAVNSDGSFTYDPTVSAAIQALDAGDVLMDTFGYTITSGGSTPYSHVVTSLNPVAYYTMDAEDITGNVVSNRGSLSNTATLTAGATFTGATGGLFGGGLNADNNSNHRLTVDAGSIDIGNDWTISTWFNDLHDTAGWRTLTRGTPNDHQVIVENGQNDLGVFANGNGNFRDSGADLLPGDTTWHHLAAVGNATANTTSFYIDGVFVGQSDRASTTNIETIGNHLTGGQPFAQTIDEFAVFDYGLSPAQIAELASLDLAIVDSATVTLTVNGLNDAPVLTGSNSFDGVVVNDPDNDGNAVSELTGTITDADDMAVIGGIAVTGFTVNGAGAIFQYSTNGTDWLNVSDLGTIDINNALLLEADDRIRFSPDGSAQVDGSITFKAWDQTTTETAGMLGDADPSGGTTSFSTGSETSTVITVNATIENGVLQYGEQEGRNDEVTIWSDGTSVFIHDDAGPITTDDGVQVDANTVSFLLSPLWEDIRFDANDFDDTITVGDMPGFDGSLTIDGEDGFDSVIFSSGMTLALGTGVIDGTDENLDVDAETFFANYDAAVSVVGTGTIDIDATGGVGDFIGIQLKRASLSSEDGDITLDGVGGDTGNANDGVILSHGTQITTTGGSVAISGTSTSPDGANDGVSLVTGSDITVGGDGTITLEGTSSGDHWAYGVLLFTGTELTTANGDITLIGTSDSTGSGNSGIYVSGATVSAGGVGSVNLDGQGAGAGANSNGLRLTKSTIETAGGDITLTGTGGGGTKGNTGVEVGVATSVTTGGTGNVTITGSGAGSSTANNGVAFISGSSVASGGDITVTGTAGTGTSNNVGISLSKASLTAAGNLGVTGEGNGSGSKNRGIYSARSDFSGAEVTLTGTGSLTASGKGNDGVYINRGSATAAGTLTIAATGGTGSSNNRGLLASGTTLTGTLDITGAANSGTTGKNNTGVHIQNSTLDPAGTITGTAGGGTANNFGVYMKGITGGFAPGNVTGNAATAEEETGGNFFSILPLLMAEADRRTTRRKSETGETLRELFARLRVEHGSLGDRDSGETPIFRSIDGHIVLDPLYAAPEPIDAALKVAGLDIPQTGQAARCAIVLNGDDHDPLSGAIAYADEAGYIVTSRPIDRADHLTNGEFLQILRDLILNSGAQPDAQWSGGAPGSTTSPNGFEDASHALSKTFGIL